MNNVVTISENEVETAMLTPIVGAKRRAAFAKNSCCLVRAASVNSDVGFSAIVLILAFNGSCGKDASVPISNALDGAIGVNW